MTIAIEKFLTDGFVAVRGAVAPGIVQSCVSFAKTLSARLIDLRSVWGLETLETGTRPGVRVARRRPGGDKILGATQNDPEERCKQPA
jgi:hypothetical protein